MSGPLLYHPHSLTLTLLIVSQGQQYKYQDSMEHPAYEVLERAVCLAGYSDEAKADLYARMAERIDHRAPFSVIQKNIHDCLMENKKEYPHG